MMQADIKVVVSDQWSHPEVRNYKKLKDELSVNGLVLRRNRLVIPSTLRSKAVDLAQGGHQGIAKTKLKQLITYKVWFPAIDKLAEKKVKKCFHVKLNQITTTRTSWDDRTS